MESKETSGYPVPKCLEDIEPGMLYNLPVGFHYKNWENIGSNNIWDKRIYRSDSFNPFLIFIVIFIIIIIISY